VKTVTLGMVEDDRPRTRRWSDEMTIGLCQSWRRPSPNL